MKGKIYAACWTTDPDVHKIENTIATRGYKNIRYLKRDIKQLAKDNYTGERIWCYILTTDKMGYYYIDKFTINKNTAL